MRAIAEFGDTDAGCCAASLGLPGVFVVSDIRLVRDGLVWQLQRDGRLEVLGAGPPGPDTLADLVGQGPQAVILDLSGTGSIDFAAQLRAALAEVKLVGFALGECETELADWARAGVCGYVEREGTAADIAITVLHALKGELYCSPRFAAQLLAQLAVRAQAVVQDRGDIIASLTPREAEILHQIRLGASNKEIARRLGISAATVKNHVHHLLEKLAVRRRSQASAMLSGLIPAN